jgi:hypothetical protein
MAESDSARTSADAETARKRRDELAARHGAWTAHDIRPADGVSTPQAAATLPAYAAACN